MSSVKKRTYYGLTTYQQRELLFRIYEATGNVSYSCQVAKTSRGTFYRWLERFVEHGYEGLRKEASRAPKHRVGINPEYKHRAVELKREDPSRGRRTIANLISKENDWRQVISPSSIQRELEAKRLWKTEADKKSISKVEAIRADAPGKTFNLDLCFLPQSRSPKSSSNDIDGEKLASPPLSENKNVSQKSQSYAGAVFQETSLSYEQKMDCYTQQRQESKESENKSSSKSPEEQALLAELKEVKKEEEALRFDRREIRKQREEEDEQWRIYRQQRRAENEQWQALNGEQKKNPLSAKKKAASDVQWQKQKSKRQAGQIERQKEDENWRQKRTEILKHKEKIGMALSAFLFPLVAVLVVIDNCSRLCLGLPLFLVGREVTSEMIVNALEKLLPKELKYLISDNGSQFTSDVFKALCCQQEIVHVRITPRRPKTNGIAERFVRTLKEMLFKHKWKDEIELAEILLEIEAEYNDRPHQGRGMNNLSPNEFERLFRLAV